MTRARLRRGHRIPLVFLHPATRCYLGQGPRSSHCSQPHLEDGSAYGQNRPTTRARPGHTCGVPNAGYGIRPLASPEPPALVPYRLKSLSKTRPASSGTTTVMAALMMLVQSITGTTLVWPSVTSSRAMG